MSDSVTTPTEPRTEAGRRLATEPTYHESPCPVNPYITAEDRRCDCGFVDDILAIEAEAASQPEPASAEPQGSVTAVTEALRERILLEAAHLNYFQSPAAHWKLRNLLDAALAAVPAPSPAVAPLDRRRLAMALHAFLPMDPGQWKVWVPDAFGGGSDQYINSSEFAARLAAYAEASEQAASPGEGELA